MKRIGCVLLLTTCVIGLSCSSASAQSGTTGDVPMVESPIMQGGIVEGTVEGAMEPIPVESYGGDIVGGGYAGGEGYVAGGVAAPAYAPYSNGYFGGYTGGCRPTYRPSMFSGYGYRPLFGGLFSRRTVYCCP